MDPAAAKQQITERVKQANKFLVTVNANPTVDQLAAAIGLTLLLNKMGKHATAVFSGKVPSTIEFLQPDKTLQPNTDSLRDFIISLDKNKADKLRYKVEDSVVRIFITPYRTSLSQKDLVFSEGDFNVEAVIALGVRQRSQLDAAITAHGRILHDATVIGINTGVAGGKAPDIGQVNWQDEQASSLCEMLVSISESFGAGLLDSQMATAFLTGIVAETERFSNKKTSPKVMTMSAQLMAAGANQQLIVSKLEPPAPPLPKQPPQLPPQLPPKQPPADSSPRQPKPPPKQPPAAPEGVLDVSHDNKKSDSGEIQVAPSEILIDEQGNLRTNEALAAEAAAQADQPPLTVPLAEPPVELPPEPPVQPPPAELPVAEPPAEPPVQPLVEPPLPPPAEPPKVSSPHAYMDPAGPPSPLPAAFGAPDQPEWAAPYGLAPTDPLKQVEDTNSSAHGPFISPPKDDGALTPSDLAKASADTAAEIVPPEVNDARSAVQNALNSAPFDPATAGPVQALNAQPLEVEPAPPLSIGDTPSLNLPVDGSTPPDIPESMMPGVDPAAPPPVPPPLMTAPGAVVPNLPKQQ